MHDIVLIKLGLNVLQGNIAKSGKADLRGGVISDRITPKRCQPNLVC